MRLGFVYRTGFETEMAVLCVDRQNLIVRVKRELFLAEHVEVARTDIWHDAIVFIVTI